MATAFLPPAPSPFYTETHHAWRAALRRFVAAEIMPHVEAWEAAGAIPRALYRKAGEIGLLRLGFPEAYGGVPSDPFMAIVTAEELAATGAGGIAASLLSHSIGAPPLALFGSEALKAKFLPAILSGERISALAITEPSGGSDVAALRTQAVRDGADYLVTGEKTYITSGLQADCLTVAVRTGGPGAAGISLLLIEGDSPGLTRTRLDKMGWWASDTAHLRFDQVRVPAAHLIGAENQGFRAIMANFNAERLALAAGAIAAGRVVLEEAVDWARLRQSFGQRLADHQVIRHKIVEMARRVNAAHAYLESIAARMQAAEAPDPRLVADLCLLKVEATLCMEFCAREAIQILGGAGYMRGTKSERIYREVRVNAIGGGSEEIMRDLAARQLGL